MKVLRPLPTVNQTIQLYKLKAFKKFGQNYLIHQNVANQIVKAAGSIKGCYVCEIGPGPGGLTRAIIEKGAESVIVIEKDEQFKLCLQALAKASRNRVRTIFDDVLTCEKHSLFPVKVRRSWDEEPPPIKIIGNLPFNISIELILQLLQDIQQKKGFFACGRVPLTLTFDESVAKRIVAPALDPERSRLSVMCQFLTQVELKLSIPAHAFSPKPDVNIGVVTFRPLVEPMIAQPFAIVEKVVKHIFHSRHKLCHKGIQLLFPNKQPELASEMFDRSEVSPAKKSYELEMSDIRNFCNAYADICTRDPDLLKFQRRLL